MAGIRLPGSEEYEDRRVGHRAQTPATGAGLAFAVVDWVQDEGGMWQRVRWYVAIDGQPAGPFPSKGVMQRWMRFKGLLTKAEIERMWPKTDRS